MSRCAQGAAAAVLLAAASASGAADEHWSVVSGETVSSRRDVYSAELGWPGVTLGFIHGLTDWTDGGLKLDVNYGVEHTTTSQLGLGLHAPFRAVAVRKGPLTLLGQFDPGFIVYAASGSTPSRLALRVPVGASLGLAVSRELRMAAGFDLPIALFVTNGSDLFLAPLFGFSVEYFVDPHLSVGLNTRFGPVYVPTAGSGASFGFVSQVAVGYRP